MRITEALKILNGSDKSAALFPVALACSFTPLHLVTFLGAHLQQRLVSRRVEVTPGLYGDLAGTLESLNMTPSNAIAIALEWFDLDPRLGFRSTARWGAAAVADILAQASNALARLSLALQRLPAGTPAALSLPTLPLPPLFHTPGWQATETEVALDCMLAEFARNIDSRTEVRIVNSRRLADESAPAQRFDLQSDLITGLPYTLAHADAVGAAFANLLLPPPPKKGIITDLDDTLWSGLVGEVGPDGVTWDLTSHTAIHGLYQRLLAALAEEGALIAVASKNDAQVVLQAFERDDLLISPEIIYPMEVHWNAKSGSVARILERWNIFADSVVFIDDSPMELAEVSAAHPGIECIRFPGSNGGLQLLRHLRDLFGKAHLLEEDAIRSISIRRAGEFAASAVHTDSEEFLRRLEAVISFDFPDSAGDPRVLELVNKTNQFNLNGLRHTEAEWRKQVTARDSVLAVVSYQDKFGPLGKIAVLQGVKKGRSLRLDVWVLSCRAFARRIEHQCLRMLFDRYEVDTVSFSFAPTAKNGPLSDFLVGMAGSVLVLAGEDFEARCPALYHTVKATRSVEVNG